QSEQSSVLKRRIPSQGIGIGVARRQVNIAGRKQKDISHLITFHRDVVAQGRSESSVIANKNVLLHCEVSRSRAGWKKLDCNVALQMAIGNCDPAEEFIAADSISDLVGRGVAREGWSHVRRAINNSQ